MKFAKLAILAICLAGAPALVGCDREVSHTDSQQTNPDGTVTKSQDTVQKDANGNIIHTTDVQRN
jgi:hypothetical protein